MAERSTFENASVAKEANIYYEGSVTSRTLWVEGERKTIGIIRPGEYTFPTEEEEEIEIYEGELTVTHPDGTENTYTPGDSFTIPADSEFQVKTDDVVDYCCTYR